MTYVWVYLYDPETKNESMGYVKQYLCIKEAMPTFAFLLIQPSYIAKSSA